RFAELCQLVGRETALSVSFTTHGHHVDRNMADSLKGSVHFIRVSMDGVNGTYETIRRRSFEALLGRLKVIRGISPFGVNAVVNERTIGELDEVAEVAAEFGAAELLLLPQQQTRGVSAISAETLR